jgi:hypothetical protein
MKKGLLLLLLFPVLFASSSCCKGGADGSATLVCSVFHHTKPIPGATVYIKYNATEFPGLDVSAYSAHQTSASNSNMVTFSNLHCGDYYLYGVGYDSSLMVPVTGGIHFKINYSDRKKTESTNVPVTE